MTVASSDIFRRSTRCASLELSEIVRITEAAKARRASGHDVLSFGTGEPDFPTPTHVVDAVAKAIRTGEVPYPPTQGLAELRAAICADADLHGGYFAEPNEVIVSTGAKQVLFNAFQATLDPGDEVILPAPYWTSYRDIIVYSGGSVVEVPCGIETEFAITPEQLDDAITPGTRWFLLNSPGNPSGRLYSRDDLVGLAEVLRRHPQVWIIADEIYQHISYGTFHAFLSVAPDLADRTLVVNGVSKSYSMIGWRLGWGIGPAKLIRAMVAVQGQCTSSASWVSQIAAIEALNGPQDLLVERRRDFEARRDLVVSRLNAIQGIQCPVPGGAFYVFPACSDLIGSRSKEGLVIEDDRSLCSYILETANVAVVPGTAFGLPGHFRLSYAYSREALEDGCERIARAIAELTINGLSG